MALATDNQRGPNRFLRFLNRIFCRGWHRLAGIEHTLPDGPVILVSNHICGLDPLLIQASVKRPVAFLMAREYYQKMSWLRWGFDMVGAIPVSPGGANRYAIKEAVAVVNAGNVLCLFPEGAANPPIPLHKILPGAALIARETGAPVVPFRISGVWPFDHIHLGPSFYRRSRARVVMGSPIYFTDEVSGREGIHSDTALIRQAIKHLK